jgi:arylsulfatase A-like enzyme
MRSIASRLLIGLAFSLAWTAGIGAAPPNLIVILSDDQRRGDYGTFGTPDIRTPTIDRLFREGMNLRNFPASCPVCSPTRATLLTGCYPDRVGVPGVIRTHAEDSWGFLSPWAVLLPRVLKSVGYRTALIGKWHLGLESPSTPTERGFGAFRGLLGDMMDDYVTHRRHGINYMRRDGGTAYGSRTIEALIRGDWTLLQDSPFGPRELNNLRDDPREQTDLFEQERRIAAELSAALGRHIQRGGEVPWQPE